ncbi:MAG: DUF1294 domain-containing protein [Promicromonosporaceae bacterium]|nr:DUF1294 domain-containing protein [Promicromonosporaceae bacterium]
MQSVNGVVGDIGLIELLLILIALLNVATFTLYAVDKRRAKQGKRRIRENVLIFNTLALGGIGAAFGMYLLRHKTRKWKFRVSLAAGLIVLAIPLYIWLTP